MTRKVIFEVEEQKIEFALGFQGAVTGESNTLVNAGLTGESLVASPDKVGSAVQVRSLTADLGISITVDGTNKSLKIGATGNLNLLKTKSDTVIPGAFSGSPLKAAVAFATAFSDSSYTITLDPEVSSSVSFSPSIESKTASGFTINLGTSSVSGLALMGWQAVVIGEEP